MRAYVPVTAEQLRGLLAAGALPGPLPAWIVDPAWRANAPEVDEEQWEFEATTLAAEALPADPGAGAGFVVAVEVADTEVAQPDDGATRLRSGIRRRQVAAVLTADLGWYGLQEAAALV